MQPKLVHQYHTELINQGVRIVMTGPSQTEIQTQLRRVLDNQGNLRFETNEETILVYADNWKQGQEPVCTINQLDVPQFTSVESQTRKATERVAA